MENVTPMNKLVDRVIKEAEEEIYKEMLKKAKTKLIDKLREQKKAQLLLNNINREIAEIKLELGHELE